MSLARPVPASQTRRPVNYAKMRFCTARNADYTSAPQNAGVLAAEQQVNLNPLKTATYLFYHSDKGKAYENQKRCFY
jgi:hypothetical protein